jgi:hypothetical protein
VRRGAAWPPAERPSSGLAVQPAVSRTGRWPHRRAVMVAERRVCPMATRSAVPAASWCQDVRMPPCLGRPVRVSVSVHMSSVRPSSDRRPVGIRCPRVRCPVSGVRCRCPVSGVRCERPASMSTLSAPVSSWSAWVRQPATRLGTGWVGNYLPVEACFQTDLIA